MNIETLKYSFLAGMNNIGLTHAFVSVLLPFFLGACNGMDEDSWIRINQLGYLPSTNKIAVFVSKNESVPGDFKICNAESDKLVWKSTSILSFGEYGPFSTTCRLDFSEFSESGLFYITAGNARSPEFRIDEDVYDGTADFLLKYMRQQRCGFNPFFNDSCHTRDGFIVFHPDPELDSTHIDVTGGWHDASDYLQYVTTSANAVFQMLFAYMKNPTLFQDEFDKDGHPGMNGIPDILDEAKWGLDWLVKMNPENGVMFNQIADDRDHMGFKIPAEDNADYGRDAERPVYYCTGSIQGSEKNKNRTTGIASTAGKYAAAFALGAEILMPFYPEFSGSLKQKAVDAYNFGAQNPGVCQTAPHLAPYFYEEDNWQDDMELAAIILHRMTGEKEYLVAAIGYGNAEPVTPWMGADTARHYQWYPFVNLGHVFLAGVPDKKISSTFTGYLKEGIDNVCRRGEDNAFNFGIPFIWCSNNLVAAILTQCRLYYELTGDTGYRKMEASLRDWLFGCNPWGTSMIIGLPEYGDYPEDTHSAVVRLLEKQPVGGLIDGPVYGSIFNNLKGLYLASEDEYLDFQSNLVVYHDDFADYSTNEPTMDGTASLTYYLSALENMQQEK